MSKVANDAVSVFDLSSAEELESAIKLLEKSLSIFEECDPSMKKIPNLFYDTYNNTARCFNLRGDIDTSLLYLLKARESIMLLAESQSPGSVTPIPELNFNICNAYIYMGNMQKALEYADYVVDSSQLCVSFYHRKLSEEEEKETLEKEEQENLSIIYVGQLNLNIHGLQTKGQVYEKMKCHQEAVGQYEQALSLVEENFGNSHKLYIELKQQIQEALISQKAQNYTGKQDSANKRAGSFFDDKQEKSAKAKRP
mmetsp:Transcript_16924/g.26049  ORF Transcript_16924/g.26049 Transcript_16924/m.26049 type:complete len:254 (+) Transcript_16924:375-1136(+)